MIKTLALAMILISSCLMSCTSLTVDEEGGAAKEDRVLYLIRHSKVSNKDSLLTSFDKHISKEGKADIRLIANQLIQRGVLLDKIISSPAKRTKSTTKRLAEVLKIGQEKIVLDTILFEAKTPDLIAVIKNLNPEYKQVAIVGHNPSIIQAANHFQKDTIFIEIPTSGLVAIQFNSNTWKYLGNKDGQFLFFEYPKLYKKEE